MLGLLSEIDLVRAALAIRTSECTFSQILQTETSTCRRV